jgi:hypothetical protein
MTTGEQYLDDAISNGDIDEVEVGAYSSFVTDFELQRYLQTS